MPQNRLGKKLNILKNIASILLSQRPASIISIQKKRCCMLVYKCIKGEICENFQNYFEVLNHKKNTRGNGITVKLPKIKLEACKMFLFQRRKNIQRITTLYPRARYHKKVPILFRNLLCSNLIGFVLVVFLFFYIFLNVFNIVII